MKHFIITIMLFILINGGAIAQYQKQVIFYDDFIDNRNNWATEGTETRSNLSISNGVYYFEHLRDERSWITSNVIDISEYKDFEIETSIKKISGINNNGFGLVWGRADSQNQFDFYISGNGSYKVNKSESGDRHEITSWTKSSTINKGNGATNKLTIRKIEDKIKFYINDNYLIEKTFHSFFGNRIGFVIYRDQRIGIDYLSVSYLEKETINTPPEITLTEPDVSRGINIVPKSTVRIAGKAEDRDGIHEVTVNGREADLEKGGHFSIEVPLAVGDNTINVVATDIKMMSSSKRFTINRQSTTNVNNPNNEKRVALVFGNSNYSGAANLGINPINDATDIASALRTLDFDVAMKTDADLMTMNNALREFGRFNRDADVALFYFAGHGMQVDRTNYLLPIGANIENKNDVTFECVSVTTVQKIMETSNTDRLNLIVLDACRNNPFRSWQRGGESGLADMTPPSGTLIAFATSPGSTASNSGGRNGLYTGELIKQLQIKQRIEDVFINTRVEVEKRSGGQQSPWELARLRGKYFLVK